MKLKSSMKFVTPLLFIFLVLCILVANLVVQNNVEIDLSYEVPFTNIRFPALPETSEGEEPVEISEGGGPAYKVHVVSLILMSILIGIAIMTVFVAFAGIGWRYYAFSNRRRERKEKKKLWDEREQAIGMSLMGFQDAPEAFEYIIDKENPHIELYVGLAEAYERKNDYQKAIENYNAILARYPRNMRALFGGAKNWETLGNYDEAIKLYQRVLEFEPDSPAALQKVRELMGKAGRYAEAIEQYQPTKQASPKVREKIAALYYRLAVEQVKANDLKTAERTLKDSLREKGDFVPNIMILANLYLKTGRPREAERLMETKADQTFATVIFQKLEDYYASQGGDLAKTLEPVVAQYKGALEEDPNANHLRLGLGKLYMKLEKYEDAEKMFIEFQREDASIPQVHLLLADLYQRTGNIDNALEEYRISSELVDIKIADFKCLHCGAMYEYWADQCTSCGGWGTIEDIFFKRGPQAVLPELKQKPLPQLPTPVEGTEEKVLSASA